MTLGEQRVALAPRPTRSRAHTRPIFSHASLLSESQVTSPAETFGSCGSGRWRCWPRPHALWGQSREPNLLGGLGQGRGRTPRELPAKPQLSLQGPGEWAAQVTVGGTHVAWTHLRPLSLLPVRRFLPQPLHLCSVPLLSQTASLISPSLCRCPSAPGAPCGPCSLAFLPLRPGSRVLACAGLCWQGCWSQAALFVLPASPLLWELLCWVLLQLLSRTTLRPVGHRVGHGVGSSASRLRGRQPGVSGLPPTDS